MIIDSLQNRSRYQGLHPRITAALEYLAQTDLSQLALGSHELDGKKLFAIVSEYDTWQRGKEPFEVHRRYIDVQYLQAGEEEFGYLSKPQQQPCTPYQSERDFEEFSYELNRDQASYIALRAGNFAVFFPEDAHMPCCTITQPSHVRKVVIKVQIAD